MKNILLYKMIVLILLFSGCTKNFDDINTNPVNPNSNNFDPNYLLTSAQMSYANVTEYQLFEIAPMVQVISSTLNYYGGGDKYNLFLFSYNTRHFSDGLTSVAQLIEAKSLAEKKDAERYSNLIQICDIMFVMTMQRITDVYGDIPYSQAGRAKEGIQYPAYDKQEDIYKNMLVRLETAIGKLDDTKTLATGDLIYAGNISKWKKLGYSLMLRVAMRLTKADAATAQLYAEKAAPNVFTNISDDAMVSIDRGINQYNQLTIDLSQVRWSKTFIDYLKNNDDPRLYTLTEKSDTGHSNNDAIRKVGLRYTKEIPVPQGFINEVPIGMPNGYDLEGPRDISTAPGYPGPTGTGDNISPLGNYARPPVALVGIQTNVPVQLITYAQTELLLAEAKVRGWNVGVISAAEHYKNGVTAAMQSLSKLNTAVSVQPDAIAEYTNSHVLDASTTNAIKMINSEYWVASLFDFTESWSNYRRSGYPNLVPVNYPDNITVGTIPRRLTYPLTENSLNNISYQAVLSRMNGKDVNTSRVWWDKQ